MVWDEVCEKAMELFSFGSVRAEEHGLILVDTKYEFGVLRDERGNQRVILADEIHTQDSSRYWIRDSYQERFEAGLDPQELDKEYIRRWLLARGWSGDGEPPQIPDELRIDLSQRYIEAYERITGEVFEAPETNTKSIEQIVIRALAEN